MGSGTARPVTWNGVEYPSMAHAARAKGVTRERMRQLVELGCTCDADMPGVSQHKSEHLRKPCQWNDVQYSSITAAAEAIGVSVPVMRWRLSQGYASDADMKRQLKQYRTKKRRRAVQSELAGTTYAVHVNTGSNRYANEDKEQCWHCSDIPDQLAYTYFGAPLCASCWDSWWLTTEDGQTDPPFDQIRNSFWIGGAI